MKRDAIHAALAAIVGLDQVSVDSAACDLSTSDIFEWPDRKAAVAVIWPADASQVADAVIALREASLAIVPRGAGLSYTGGLAVERDAVVIDTRRMDRIDLDPDNLIATVGAGASWESVASALKPLGLRSRQPGPISGARSTVGGLASQGLPAGTDGILGLTVVLPDGTIARTGATSVPVRTVPDATGLFLGDCGALGIKTEIVLRLEPLPHAEFASFEFDDAGPMIEALNACMRAGIVSRAFAMDAVKAEQARAVDSAEAIGAAVSVLRDSGSWSGAAKNAAKLVGFAVSRAKADWALHLTIESPTPDGAAAQLRRAREICHVAGREAADVFPRTLYSNPYSVRGLVGPDGERWVPVHGIFRASDSAGAMESLEEYLGRHVDELARRRIRPSWLLSSSGPYILIEPMLYWRDRLNPLHLAHLSPRNAARFGSFADDPSTRSFVRQLREGLRDTMDKLGAVHCQIGRFYCLDRQLDAAALAQLRQFKALVDPQGLMNPGVLGLDSTRRAREVP